MRIAVTRFASNASVVRNLTSDAASLKTAVNSLSATGATAADKGMASAQAALQGARQDAKKIVIFFTDGVPTTIDRFDVGVANGAVGTAKTLKAGGTQIYSIGIFSGANPAQTSFGGDETSSANRFMHAVSSNYPNATAYNNWGNGSNRGYYKATNNATDLTRIFDDIQQEIITESAYTGVSITDTLSQYARQSGIAYNTAIVKNVDGMTFYEATGGVNLTATNLPDDAETPILNRDYTLRYSGDGNGAVRVEFANDYALAHMATYTVSYDIEPTDLAYTQYAEYGYGATVGDAGTGETSEGKHGLRSNENAQVCYTFDGQSGCAAYQHPVLQVPAANIAVAKQWLVEQPAEGTKLTIHLAGGNVAKTATLEAGNEWNGGFESLAPGAYQLYEDAVSGYSPADGTGLIGINVNKDELWQAFDAGQVKTYEAVFRNERNVVQLSEGVNVSKTVQGNDHDGAFAFTLTDITTDEQKARNTGTLLRGMEGGKQTVSIGGLKDGEAKTATFTADANGDPLTFTTPLTADGDTYTFAVTETQPDAACR